MCSFKHLTVINNYCRYLNKNNGHLHTIKSQDKNNDLLLSKLNKCNVYKKYTEKSCYNTYQLWTFYEVHI